MRPSVGLFWLWACLLGCQSTPANKPAVAPSPVPAAGNLLQNSGFEQDWHVREFGEQRRFLLLHTSDMGLGEADGQPDHWRFERVAPVEAWETASAHTGERSIRFRGPGRAFQRLRMVGEQQWKGGGAFYSEFLPMERGLAAQIARRPITVGAWCRTEGIPPGGEPLLQVRVESAVRPEIDQPGKADAGVADFSASFPAGTHNWEHREIRIDPDKLQGTPYWVIVSLVSPGAQGTAWFDDVTCVEAQPDLPNLLPNGDFEQSGPDGRLSGWGAPELWTWWRNPYYIFTGWSHAKSTAFRGGAYPDRVLSRSVEGSLRFTVYPGDNFAVPSAPIVLNQQKPHPLEVRAMVRADSLRALEVMAKDEDGEWLPQADFLGDDMENNPGTYNMGSTGGGTYGWMCVRKFFSPRKPVRSLRLYLCARGFDGVIVEKDRVGTVWWDDVCLFEHGVNRKAPPPAKAASPRLRVRDLQPGDRLWGRNLFRVVLELPDNSAVEAAKKAATRLEVTPPGGPSQAAGGKARLVRPATPGQPGEAVIEIPYRIERLCRSWQEQYDLKLTLEIDGKRAETRIPFGTPSRLLTAGASASYLYPDETVTLYANLNVSRESLPELARCEFASASGEPRQWAEIRDFSAVLRPQAAPNFINTDRLLQVKLDRTRFQVHPWTNPVRDNAVKLILHGNGKGEPVLAASDVLRFGFLERGPKPALPAITRTAVNERGYLTVNGRPYFPVFWAPHFGLAPEANYPPSQSGCKSVDLTPIILGPGKAPDAMVKAKLLAKVAEVKDDPKLFQYELGEGEMQLQGGNWRERVEWLKTAIGWVRQADPNHLVNGPSSWLVGAPGHNAAMQAFVPQWDAIGVEASFEDVPDVEHYARPLMKGRNTAVLVGLETYFYQPDEILRWRGYRAVVDGAAGIGLCPSGMLQARPDKVNFLRGLNAEFRALASILTAPAPPDAFRCSRPGVSLLERVFNGKRYLIAVRDRGAQGVLLVRFTAPSGRKFSHVRPLFEDDGPRQIPTGTFDDRFDTPYTVRVYELTEKF